MKEIPLTQGYVALTTAEEAAKAYDDAARNYAGEFARTNFNFSNPCPI